MLTYGTYILNLLNTGNTSPTTGVQQSSKGKLDVATSRLLETNLNNITNNLTSAIKANDLQEEFKLDHHLGNTMVRSDDVEDLTAHGVLSDLFKTHTSNDNVFQNHNKVVLVKKSIDYNLDAWMLDSMGNYEQALVKINKAIELNPQNGGVFSTKARILDHLGRYEEGLIAANKAIELNPSDFTAFTEQASILYHLGRYEEGLIVVNKAIELNSSHGEASAVKVEILKQLEHNTLATSTQSVQQNSMTTYQDLGQQDQHNITSAVMKKYNNSDDVKWHVAKDASNSAKTITSMTESSTVNATIEETNPRNHGTDDTTLIELILGSSSISIILGAIVFIYKKCKNSETLYSHDGLALVSPKCSLDLEQEGHIPVKLIGEEANYGSSECN